MRRWRARAAATRFAELDPPVPPDTVAGRWLTATSCATGSPSSISPGSLAAGTPTLSTTCSPKPGGWGPGCERPRYAAPDRLFAGYALDLDGTVYLGDDALPGAVEAIRRLRELGRGVVFVTNKPLETAADYAAKLTRLGMPCEASDVVTATDALLAYLAAKHPDSRVLAVAEPAVQAALRGAGHQVTDEPAEAEVVVVSFDRTFDYAKLTAAYRAVRLYGAALVATNPGSVLPDAGRRAAGLRCDARRDRGVHRRPRRGGHRQAKRAHGRGRP